MHRAGPMATRPMAEAAARVAHRARVLRALGVSAYRLRTRAADDNSSLPEVLPSVAGLPGALGCVVVLPDQSSARSLDLVGHALQAFGAHFARAPRIRVANDQLMQAAPAAHVYVVLGRDQAQALGRALPAAQLQAAQVLLVDAPESLLVASGKRQLWQALKRARRALAAVAGQAGA